MPDGNVLLVEGPDDLHMLLHLFGNYMIPAEEMRQRTLPANKIGIKQEGGIDTLLQNLGVWIKGSETQRLGIIVDADTDIAARWQALGDRLRNAGYTNVPKAPDVDGTIITQPNLPAVGIWLMPDNTLPGMLEDFVRFLVPTDDVLWTKAEQCLQTLSPAERRFPVTQQIKAHVHTWLAWQEEPGKPIGQAITKHYLDPNVLQAQQLIGWIRRLFKFPSA